MRYLTSEEIIALHAEIILRSGGILGIRDRQIGVWRVAGAKHRYRFFKVKVSKGYCDSR